MSDSIIISPCHPDRAKRVEGSAAQCVRWFGFAHHDTITELSAIVIPTERSEWRDLPLHPSDFRSNSTGQWSEPRIPVWIFAPASLPSSRLDVMK